MTKNQTPVSNQVVLTIHPEKVFRWLFMAVSLLIVMSAISIPFLLREDSLSEPVKALMKGINMDKEDSIPTWFNVTILAVNMLLLGVTYFVSRTRADGLTRGWLSLTAIFAFLSLDEMVRIHERVGEVIHDKWQPGGAFGFAWVIPGSIAVVILGFAFLGFLRSLPPRTMWLILLAGAIYVGGAIGVEMIEAYVLDRTQSVGWFQTIVLLEEGMEMWGQALLCYTLLDYLGRQGATLKPQPAPGAG
ncbi:MAG: hypothetical protein R3D84_07095 [Paracoccaceae bacterium]